VRDTVCGCSWDLVRVAVRPLTVSVSCVELETVSESRKDRDRRVREREIVWDVVSVCFDDLLKVGDPSDTVDVSEKVFVLVFVRRIVELTVPVTVSLRGADRVKVNVSLSVTVSVDRDLVRLVDGLSERDGE